MTVGVFIVEDSEVARELVRRVIDDAPDLVVVGVATSVEEALAHPQLDNADVVLLDMWLPGRSGLGVVRQLAAERSVIVVSDNAEGSPMGREALAQGAAAVFEKAELARPAGRQRLCGAVRGASKRAGSAHAVVAIVGSTGAMTALERIVPAIAKEPISLLVLQHMPAGREGDLARFLTSLGMPSRTAKTSDAIEIGRALVATAEGHLVVSGPSRVSVVHGPPVDGHVPAATELLRSAARLGPRLVAVVLSGMGRDGADAVSGLIGAGATVLALSPRDCAAPSMPAAALAASTRVSAVPLDALPTRVQSFARIAGRKRP